MEVETSTTMKIIMITMRKKGQRVIIMKSSKGTEEEIREG